MDTYASNRRINFATAFQMAKQWGYHIPEDIRIYCIEVKFSQGCTPEIAEKLNKIVEHILCDLAGN